MNVAVRPHQQQPPNPAECPACGEEFSNERRMQTHLRAQTLRGEPGHPHVAERTQGERTLCRCGKWGCRIMEA